MHRTANEGSPSNSSRPNVERRTASVLKAVDVRHPDDRGAGKRAARAGSPQHGGGTIKSVSGQQRWIPEFNECRPMIGAEDFGVDQPKLSRRDAATARERKSCKRKRSGARWKRKKKLHSHTGWMTHRASCCASRSVLTQPSLPRR